MRPAICPVCGRVHYERVPLACLACMGSGVEDTTFVERPEEPYDKYTREVSEAIFLYNLANMPIMPYEPDTAFTSESPDDEPDFDSDDTQEHVYLFDEGDDDDGNP